MLYVAIDQTRGLQTFLSEDHISYYTTARGSDILRNVIFWDMLHSTKSTMLRECHIFFRSCINKMYLRSDEIASRAVVWRPLQ